MPGISPFISLKKGYYRFLGLLSWDATEDQLAAEKLNLLIKTMPKGIDRETFQGYYLTGERTMVIIGQVDSNVHGGAAVAIQKLSSMVTFETNIEASFYHAVEAHELVGAVKEAMGKPRTSRRKA